MPIETFDDIIEEIMDGFGIYGAHDNEETKPCRCCASSGMADRLRAAFYVDERLNPKQKLAPIEEGTK